MIAEFRTAYAETTGGAATLAALQERAAELAATSRRQGEQIEALNAQLEATRTELAVAKAAAESSAAEAAHASKCYGAAVDRLNATTAEVASLKQASALLDSEA